MRMPRFYDPQDLNEGMTIELCENAVQHISRALRMRAGETIKLFNGDGFDYLATLSCSNRRARILVISLCSIEP